MPTYEYQCKKCAHRFERFQQITEKPVNTCPQCGGTVRRLISAGAGFIFKGSGFYATDYRSRDYRDRQRQESKGKQPSCPAAGQNEQCPGCPANKDKDD